MIDQTTHERRVSASVSTLAAASVAHPEESSLSFPNVITQADFVYVKPEQNPSVSYLYNMSWLSPMIDRLSNLRLVSLRMPRIPA